jgi:hypothetical protein
MRARYGSAAGTSAALRRHRVNGGTSVRRMRAFTGYRSSPLARLASAVTARALRCGSRTTKTPLSLA